MMLRALSSMFGGCVRSRAEASRGFSSASERASRFGHCRFDCEHDGCEVSGSLHEVDGPILVSVMPIVV